MTAGWTTTPGKINDREVEAGSSFKDVVMAEAQRKHYTNFRVSVDGREIDVANAPATIGAGMNVKVSPYDKAGVVVETWTVPNIWTVK